mmetsp:Transcript_16593/g.32385  ORF Transcript_16593/g.32385 Transcript_16593/m.32385 type:complete len:228 (+) Transcript_16593:85-768(+)
MLSGDTVRSFISTGCDAFHALTSLAQVPNKRPPRGRSARLPPARKLRFANLCLLLLMLLPIAVEAMPSPPQANANAPRRVGLQPVGLSIAQVAHLVKRLPTLTDDNYNDWTFAFNAICVALGLSTYLAFQASGLTVWPLGAEGQPFLPPAADASTGVKMGTRADPIFHHEEATPLLRHDAADAWTAVGLDPSFRRKNKVETPREHLLLSSTNSHLRRLTPLRGCLRT